MPDSMPAHRKTITRFYLLAFFLLLGYVQIAAAQLDTIVPVDNPEKVLRKLNISKITSGGINLWRDQFVGHWSGVDFGFNLLLHPDYKGYDTDFMKNDILFSNSVYVNFVQQSIGLQRYRNSIGIVTGLGLHFYNYHLDDNTSITLNENNVIQPVVLDLENIKKSKFLGFELLLPVLFEFQVPINHRQDRIYFSGGPYGGLRLGNYTKVKYKIERNEKLRASDHFSMPDFKYGLMFRTGYKWVNLYAAYDLVPLFKEGKGPVLTPFSAGITLISF